MHRPIRRGCSRGLQDRLEFRRVSFGRTLWEQGHTKNLVGGADFVKMMSGSDMTSERHPQIQDTPEEFAATMRGTSDFGTCAAAQADTDISVPNAHRARAVSVETLHPDLVLRSGMRVDLTEYEN